MLITQIVRCPDCGSMAQRHFQTRRYASTSSTSDSNEVTARTECHDCDYFLEIGMTTGQVLASHIAPVFRYQPLATPSVLESSVLQMQVS